MDALISVFRLLAKIWRAVPNRLLAVLVFFGMLGGAFWAYATLFVTAVSTVEFRVSGPSSARVELVGSYQASGMYAAISAGTGADCAGTCSFPKMPPVRYAWSASADGYSTSTGTFDLPARSLFPVAVVLAPTVRYVPAPSDGARRALESRVRRDVDAAASAPFRRGASSGDVRALSGARVELAVAGGRALLASPAFDGGWAWWGAGRWAPLLPGSGPARLAWSDAAQALAILKTSGAAFLVDVRTGTVMPVDAAWEAAGRGPRPGVYVLSRSDVDAARYDAASLSVVGSFTGARDVAFLSDGSRIDLSSDGSAARVTASGAAPWPLPGPGAWVAAWGDDLAVGLSDGSVRLAKDAAEQAKVLAR